MPPTVASAVVRSTRNDDDIFGTDDAGCRPVHDDYVQRPFRGLSVADVDDDGRLVRVRLTRESALIALDGDSSLATGAAPP